MKKKYLFTHLFLPLCLFFLHTNAQVSVLSQHNDLNRTGWNNAETILNVKNVNPQQFGKLFTRNVDDEIYAQPLVVSNVPVQNGFHNIVYVATVSNSIYAFDADSINKTTPYWQVNLTAAGKRPVLATDMTGACGGNYTNFTTHIGIVGTPVIDSSTKTLFVVARSVNTAGGTGFVQYLHALDISTGAEKPHSPVLITAQVNGNGAGASNGLLFFDAQHENQRPGLLLSKGMVYIAFASHCDWDPYHGWLLGYDTSSLLQTVVYNTSPNGTEAGIWMSGAAPAADDAGNIYIASGNGTVDTNTTNPVNLGESIFKLSKTGNNLSVASYFTPYNYDSLNSIDLDMGVIQVLLIPQTPYAVSGDKNGELFLLNRDNMGGFNSQNNNVIQRLDLGRAANLHASLGYYKGAGKEFMYVWSENVPLFAFPFNRNTNRFDDANKLQGLRGPSVQNGAFLATSSNGSDDSTAILWASYAAAGDAENEVTPGVLHAFLAADITKEIWNSSMDPNDQTGNYAKFVCPTIANGKVYMASFSNQLVVYGLVTKKTGPCSTTNIALNKPASATSVEANYLLPAAATDGNLTTRWSSQFSDPQSIQIDLGQTFFICKVVLRWETALGKDFSIQVSSDGIKWNTVQSISGNINIINVIPLNSTARYIRMLGTRRGTVYGYSLYEFEVYGEPYSNPNRTGVPLVYPNPATDHISILKGNEDINNAVIYDIAGRMMIKAINDGSVKMEIPVLNFSKGLYIVRVETTNHIYKIKIVH